MSTCICRDGQMNPRCPICAHYVAPDVSTMLMMQSTARLQHIHFLEKQLFDLLAVIHCDGGHHQAAVGTERAVKDAIAIWNRLPRDAEGRLVLTP